MQDRTVAEAEDEADHRLIMFSDGVVAIAITLLAIDLPLPEGSGVHAARAAYGIMLGLGLSIPLFFATRFAWAPPGWWRPPSTGMPATTSSS
jgi:uncharacterized membrane protein